MAKANGLSPYPEVVAELGPGDSLGTGLAALISGCGKYFAFDVAAYASSERNATIFEELVKLFSDRTPIPGNDEFPKVKPQLESYAFPAEIFDEERLRHALDQARLARIRESIGDLQRKDSLIQYKAPWSDARSLESESVDMILSQAVLEYVDDLRGTYDSMRAWLKPSGYVSHQIDFKCHGTADEWNGHWAYSDFVWRMIRGKRTYFLNREPHSRHVEALVAAGFKLVCDRKVTLESRLTLDQLAPRFRSISAEDLTTSGTFIQAVKAR
jgi:SAM-dependent methyltransferase